MVLWTVSGSQYARAVQLAAEDRRDPRQRGIGIGHEVLVAQPEIEAVDSAQIAR